MTCNSNCFIVRWISTKIFNCQTSRTYRKQKEARNSKSCNPINFSNAKTFLLHMNVVNERYPMNGPENSSGFNEIPNLTQDCTINGIPEVPLWKIIKDCDNVNISVGIYDNTTCLSAATWEFIGRFHFSHIGTALDRICMAWLRSFSIWGYDGVLRDEWSCERRDVLGIRRRHVCNQRRIGVNFFLLSSSISLHDMAFTITFIVCCQYYDSL